MAKLINIYGLVDPRTNELRYVGQTKNSIESRLYSHIKDSHKSNNPSYKKHWIKQVVKNGFEPEIILLEQVAKDKYIDAEIFWIAYFKSLGARLCNLTVGGEGTSGYTHTDEQRQNNSQVQKNAYANGRVLWNKGVPMSEETKQRVSIAKTGKTPKIDPEVDKERTRKIVATRKARGNDKHTEVSKRKMAISQKKRFATSLHPNAGKSWSTKRREAYEAGLKHVR